MTRTRLKFKYVNHRDEGHEYVVAPVSLTFEMIQLVDPEEAHWLLNGQVMERDGKPVSKVRSFIMTKMRDVEEVKVDV